MEVGSGFVSGGLLDYTLLLCYQACALGAQLERSCQVRLSAAGLSCTKRRVHQPYGPGLRFGRCASRSASVQSGTSDALGRARASCEAAALVVNEASSALSREGTGSAAV